LRSFGNKIVPFGALAGGARPEIVAHRYHDVRARICGGFDALRAAVRARQNRPADADLGEIPGRLARGRGPRQPDGQAGVMRTPLIPATQPLLRFASFGGFESAEARSA